MTLIRASVGRLGIRVGSGIERAMRGCRGVLSSQIDRRFLLRWSGLKGVVRTRGGDPAALDWSNLQKCLLPDLFEDRGLRLEIPSQGSFGYYVLFAQPGGGGIYGRREITVTFDDALAYHDLLIADPRPDSVQQQWGSVVESLLEANSPRTIWTVSEIPFEFKGHKLGDILLTGTTWRGILDLEDPEAVRRLAARLNTV
jgi:hypothetical protein